MNSNKRKILLLAMALTSSGAFAQQTFSPEDICKGAIGVVMGRDVNTMKSSMKGDEVLVNYVRTVDKKRFDYKCQIDQAKKEISWAGFIDGKWGRWRKPPNDSQITYNVDDSKLIIEEHGMATETYTHASF